ncbi:Undecaprenyl diphosphate synthase [Aspergillus campestris IBT 28561]|uniref:Alkyl transferase n=1 Tax=Aspergillus campestris (strain IBT 28561) TaxID=1392248 RepID=A0A2I1D862_ASPC2|nr:Undecaprenyl diphosphate synthase [Aspergillus campestris IBT 28561]PKY06070.1 Undecaprenyl diphosphate synthase [Aspergillus campestris IBT 28561]
MTALPSYLHSFDLYSIMNSDSTWSKDLLRLLVQQGPIPKHVGFIMDGNRRYGKEDKMPLEKILEFCFATGIQAVTVYAFSLANFRRSAEEIKAVMVLLKVCLARLLQDGGVAERFEVKLRICGNKSLLRAETVEDLEHAERLLAKNTKCVLNICLAYGSRHEITSSVKAAVMTGHGVPLPRQDMIETLEDTMSTAGCPPLDFLIRTSGTSRLSDFMLWQCHEATDIVILEKNWPELKHWDFTQVLGQ